MTSPRKGERTLVSCEQGHEAAGIIGAVKYMECSTLTGEGVGDVAEAAVQIATSWVP